MEPVLVRLTAPVVLATTVPVAVSGFNVIAPLLDVNVAVPAVIASLVVVWLIDPAPLAVRTTDDGPLSVPPIRIEPPPPVDTRLTFCDESAPAVVMLLLSLSEKVAAEAEAFRVTAPLLLTNTLAPVVLALRAEATVLMLPPLAPMLPLVELNCTVEAVNVPDPVILPSPPAASWMLDRVPLPAAIPPESVIVPLLVVDTCTAPLSPPVMPAMVIGPWLLSATLLAPPVTVTGPDEKIGLSVMVPLPLDNVSPVAPAETSEVPLDWLMLPAPLALSATAVVPVTGAPKVMPPLLPLNRSTVPAVTGPLVVMAPVVVRLNVPAVVEEPTLTVGDELEM